MLANDARSDSRFVYVEEFRDTRAQISVPITSGDEVLSVLGIEQTEVNAFDETDQFTAQTLAHQLGVAIENARLLDQASAVAVLEERNRLAREMHDTLAQGFTGIVLQLEAAEQAADDKAPLGELVDHLDRARSLARESLQEARRSVWNLLPKALEDRPLDSALAQEVERWSAGGDEHASFGVAGARRDLPADVQTALLRIAQESLTNARRHAGATEVVVDLIFSADSVCLRVRDDGSGFDVAAARARGGGFGLSSMDQRARLLGGSLTLRRSNGRGTLVEAVIPTASQPEPVG